MQSEAHDPANLPDSAGCCLDAHGERKHGAQKKQLFLHFLSSLVTLLGYVLPRLLEGGSLCSCSLTAGELRWNLLLLLA